MSRSIKSYDADLAGMQKHIKPLNMNGLEGRMLRMPANKTAPQQAHKREILLIYGHHPSLERMYGFAEVLSDYGNVTMPDLPGFGGMDSLSKLGMEPNYDNLADYLASFIKLRYKRKKFLVAGFSLGFVVVTRMLQRYPELAKQVVLLVSIAGFTHKYDFAFSPTRQRAYKFITRTLSGKLASRLFYNVALHPAVIRAAYDKGPNAKAKFKDLTPEQKKAALDFEVLLWRSNDAHTHWKTNYQMFTLDHCKQQIDLPVHHISIDDDQYFDGRTVEQHMRVIFTDYTEHIAQIDRHAPSIIANKEDASPMFPQSILDIVDAC